MKRVLFVVAALFVNSSSVMATHLETKVIGLALENGTEYDVHVSFHLNNYDVFTKGWKILEPITLGPCDFDRFLAVAPKGGEISDQPDEIFFSVSRKWAFKVEEFHFQVILNTHPYEYEFLLRGEDGQDTTQLSKGIFFAECYRGDLDGWPNFFIVNVSQHPTIDGVVRGKLRSWRHLLSYWFS